MTIMKYLQFLIGMLAFLWPLALPAAELKLQPSDIDLTSPGASQRLIVVLEDQKQIIGDRTSQSKFTSSNPAVVTVSTTGIVQAVGDGEAVITASHDGRQATAKVKASKSKEPADESFRNQII